MADAGRAVIAGLGVFNALGQNAASLCAALAEQRHYAAEPAHAIQHGRPTKRDRRQLQQARENPDAASGWGSRWSASLDG